MKERTLIFDKILRVFFINETKINELKKKVDELKETYILFICMDDPFCAGLPMYTIENIIMESPTTLYNDKTHKLFYNASSFAKEKNQQVRGLLALLRGC